MSKPSLTYVVEDCFGEHPKITTIALANRETFVGPVVRRAEIQLQFSATIETPCCKEPVVLARCFAYPRYVKTKPQITYPIQWSGIACPKCQATYTFEINYE